MTEFNRPAFENTFRLEPKETDRFYPSKVKECIEQVVKQHLTDKEYDHAQARSWAEKIADEIKEKVKNLSIPCYKVVVQTVIG